MTSLLVTALPEFPIAADLAVQPALIRLGIGRPKSFDQEVQDIASAGHLRGVVLVASDRIVGSVEPALLCRTIRAAREQTRGQGGRYDQVARIVHSIALRLGVPGAVQVPRNIWSLLRGYAHREATTAAGHPGARQ